MGVQFFYHAPDTVLHQFLFVNTVNIQVVDGHLGYLQFAQGGVGSQIDAHLSKKTHPIPPYKGGSD